MTLQSSFELTVEPYFHEKHAEDAETHFANAMNEANLGNWDQAIDSWERAIALRPDWAAAHSNMGLAALNQGAIGLSIASSERAIELAPGILPAYSNLGLALSRIGETNRAIEICQKAISLGPQFVEPYFVLGDLYVGLGQVEDAEAIYRKAIRQKGAATRGYYSLCNLIRGKLPTCDFAAIETLATDPSLSDRNRAHLYFGLAQVLDNRGEYARAASFANRANQAKIAGNPPVNIPIIAQAAELIVATYRPDFLRRLANAGSSSTRPIFIVGLPRSGTTLVEQILASHSAIHGAGELRLVSTMVNSLPALLGSAQAPMYCIPNLTPALIRLLARDHLQNLAAIDGGRSARIVDKMPQNYFHLGLLAAMFPDATFIHCRRDLRDTAVSCWTTFFSSIDWTCEKTQLAEKFRQYLRVMDHWRTVLPGRIFEVQYEDIVSDLPTMARRLIDACGLPWESACQDFHQTARHVTTSSSAQVRQPIYNRSVGRWKHYRDSLADLLQLIPHPASVARQWQ